MRDVPKKNGINELTHQLDGTLDFGFRDYSSYRSHIPTFGEPQMNS